MRAAKLQNGLGYLVEVLKYLVDISFMEQLFIKHLHVMSKEDKDRKIKVFFIIV